MTDASSEKAFEQGYDALDMREDVRKRRREWHSLSGVTSLAELYVEDKVRVHAHVSLPSGLHKREVSKFCAVFNRFTPTTDVHVDDVVALQLVDAEPIETRNNTYRLDDAVFIGVVNVAQEPKGVGCRAIPSVIRLQPSDECFLTRRKVLDDVAPVVPILIESGEDGECRSFVRAGSPTEGELPNNLVERRPQVVCNIPNERAPLQGWVGLDFSLQDAISCLLVQVSNCAVGVSVKEPLDKALQALEVFIRPTKLEPGSV